MKKKVGYTKSPFSLKPKIFASITQRKTLGSSFKMLSCPSFIISPKALCAMLNYLDLLKQDMLSCLWAFAHAFPPSGTTMFLLLSKCVHSLYILCTSFMTAIELIPSGNHLSPFLASVGPHLCSNNSPISLWY